MIFEYSIIVYEYEAGIVGEIKKCKGQTLGRSEAPFRTSRLFRSKHILLVLGF